MKKRLKLILLPFNLIAIGIIRIYQYTISPLLGPACRFEPSCSEYGVEAFRKHGALKGFTLTAKRVCRCHPWGGHGYDPVPEPESTSNHAARVLPNHLSNEKDL